MATALDRVEAILGRRRNGRWIRDPRKYMQYILDGARTIKDPANWCQGAYALDKRGQKLGTARTRRAVRFCFLGALERATPEFREYDLCKHLLAIGAGVPHDKLSALNDLPGEPKETYIAVIGVFAATIAILKEAADDGRLSVA
jgi:hypothetical protein